MAKSDLVLKVAEINKSTTTGAEYLGSRILCATTPSENHKCLMRANEYYRVGERVYRVENATLSGESNKRRKHYANEFVEEDEVALLLKYAESGCQPMLVDWFGEKVSYERIEGRSAKEAAEETTNFEEDAEQKKEKRCLVGRRPLVVDLTDVVDSDEGEEERKRKEKEAEKKEAEKKKRKWTEEDVYFVERDEEKRGGGREEDVEIKADEEAESESEDEEEEDSSAEGEYVCYILQSMEKPSRTYVGITNNRYRRLRQHNGELTGGARATRGNRPWRMAAYVEGFKKNKVAALQFEWSMHHPAKRRLKAPWYGLEGRLNCVRQLFASSRSASSSGGSASTLNLVALPLCETDRCLATR